MNFDDYLGLKQADALYRNMRALVISSVFVNALLLDGGQPGHLQMNQRVKTTTVDGLEYTHFGQL